MTRAEPTEKAYERLTGYRFARRYVEGRSVADLCRGEPGYGPAELADCARSVTVTRVPSTATDKWSGEGGAPPELPHGEGSFEAVVALGVIEDLEDPEALVAEVRHVIGAEGIFVVSAADRLAHANERPHTAGRSEMYVPELREMLQRHFAHVEIFRLGGVAGGVVMPEGELSQPEIGTAALSSPAADSGLPRTLSVLAVCSDSQIPLRGTGGPYLLLDSERTVIEESEDRREDIELLREEVRRVQETEVQAFEEALQLHGAESLSLKAELRDCRQHLEELRERAERLRKRARNADRLRSRLEEIEASRVWRLLNLYRNLRLRGTGR